MRFNEIIRQLRQLTDVLWVYHSTLGVVLVNHVLLRQLEVQVGAALLVPAENRPVNLHPCPEVGRLFVFLFGVSPFIC